MGITAPATTIGAGTGRANSRRQDFDERDIEGESEEERGAVEFDDLEIPNENDNFPFADRMDEAEVPVAISRAAVSLARIARANNLDSSSTSRRADLGTYTRNVRPRLATFPASEAAQALSSSSSQQDVPSQLPRASQQQSQQTPLPVGSTQTPKRKRFSGLEHIGTKLGDIGNAFRDMHEKKYPTTPSKAMLEAFARIDELLGPGCLSRRVQLKRMLCYRPNELFFHIFVDLPGDEAMCMIEQMENEEV